jgi:hypothetical protein
MFIHASRVCVAGLGTLFVWLMGAPSDAAAQGRFQLLGQEPVAAVTGLTVYTIRDRATAGCYTLFALEPAQLPPLSRAEAETTEVLTAEQLESVRVAELLKDAIAERNRRLVDLRSQSTSMWAVQLETLRQQIDYDYEETVRSLLPGLHPRAQVAPGWPTSTPDEVAAAVRTAIADGDSAINAARQSGVEALMERLLTSAASNRLAAAGPFACPALTDQPQR